MKKSKYLLRYHDFYYRRIATLKEQVQHLKATLRRINLSGTKSSNFAARVRHADQHTIPQDPNKREYQLKANLKKFRRYKRGLKRYRLFFCFSSRPPIILYLYLNDEKHLRQAGSKKDPYEPFKGLVSRGIFSHDPSDEKIQAWIRSLLAVAR